MYNPSGASHPAAWSGSLGEVCHGRRGKHKCNNRWRGTSRMMVRTIWRLPCQAKADGTWGSLKLVVRSVNEAQPSPTWWTGLSSGHCRSSRHAPVSSSGDRSLQGATQRCLGVVSWEGQPVQLKRVNFIECLLYNRMHPCCRGNLHSHASYKAVCEP